MCFLCFNENIWKLCYNMKTNEIGFFCVTKNGTYDNFQDNNYVNMGFIWIFIWIFIFLCERLSDFFYVGVLSNNYNMSVKF
jgi:hypothetical protein